MADPFVSLMAAAAATTTIGLGTGIVLLDDRPAAIADLRRRAEAAGRRPHDLSVSVFAFQPPAPDAVERVTLVAPRRLADALPLLDRMARLHASRR